MKILVDVPDEEYEAYALAITFGMGSTAIRRILDGTPLPKGHGRLIDADRLIDDFKNSRAMTFEERMKASNIVQHAYDKLCVIEADKEGAEG